MGSVYLALDTTLDRRVALKVPKSGGTANAEFMARFTREAKAAAALKHPNICSVYDTGEHEGTAYITMDFIDYLKNGNQTLAVHVDDEWLKSQGGEVTLVVDGNNHTITAPSTGGDPISVTVSLGQHTFSVKHGDSVVHDPKLFTIEKDGRKVLSITATDVRLENGIPAPKPSPEAIASGNSQPAMVPGPTGNSDWISLFNGSDVSRWSSLASYQVQGGLLIANSGQSRSAAVSSDEYADFELEAEWRITAGANGGIFYREIESTTGAGNEYQLIDPAHPQLTNAVQKTAALYGIIAPSEDFERPLGEWNTTRIVCRGSLAEHWLNGKKVVQYDTFSAEWQHVKNSSEINTGKERIGTQSQGRILLQSQTGELAFRAIRIRRLTETGQMSGSASSTGNLANTQASDLDRAATGTWIPLVDSSTFLPVPDKMKFNNGVLELETSFVFSTLQFRDVIVRAEVKKVSGQNVGITIRHSPGKEWTQAYAAWFNGTQSDGGDLFGIAKAMRTSVSLAAGNSGHSFEPDQFVDMAVSAIGDQINLYVEGNKVLSATDADYGAGAVVLGVFRNGKGLFRNVRYQSFDPAVESSSRQSAPASEMIAPRQTQEVADVQDPNPVLKNISQVHGVTANELVAWAKSLPAGYRPYWLSVRGNTKPILYDALASQTADQSEWIMQFYDHADETNWAEMKLQYRPALLNVYAKDDIDERLVLWVRNNQQYGYWLGGQDFMEEKLIEGLKWDQGEKSNRERWLPTSVVGHWFDDGPTCDMLLAWLPYHQCEWALDLPLDELPTLVEEYRTKGWQPANLNIINGSTPARCSAVFGDNPEKRKWTFSPALSVNEYHTNRIHSGPEKAFAAICCQLRCLWSSSGNSVQSSSSVHRFIDTVLFDFSPRRPSLPLLQGVDVITSMLQSDGSSIARNSNCEMLRWVGLK